LDDGRHLDCAVPFHVSVDRFSRLTAETTGGRLRVLREADWTGAEFYTRFTLDGAHPRKDQRRLAVR
jgi:hypothetical protein